jgi:hypothetical protein
MRKQRGNCGNCTSNREGILSACYSRGQELSIIVRYREACGRSERERGRGRHRERDTERETQRQRDTEREREREGERQRDTPASISKYACVSPCVCISNVPVSTGVISHVHACKQVCSKAADLPLYLSACRCTKAADLSLHIAIICSTHHGIARRNS